MALGLWVAGLFALLVVVVGFDCHLVSFACCLVLCCFSFGDWA